VRVPRDERVLLVGRRVVAGAEAAEVGVGARGEAHVGAVVLREALVVGLGVEVAAVAAEQEHVAEAVARAVQLLTAAAAQLEVVVDAERGAVGRVERGVAEEVARVRAEQLEPERGLRVELEAAVNRRELVALLREVVAGEQKTQLVLAAHVALDAQHADGGVLIEQVAVVGVEPVVVDDVARPVVGGEHHAVGVAPAPAREFHRRVRIDDGARVDGRQRRLENLDAFEEERPALGEEDRETLVRRDD
jgi:hypothetical protein